MATAKKPKHSDEHRAAITGSETHLHEMNDRYQQIATAAYYKAEARGFSAGDELSDWLAAEAEIEGMADVGPLKSRPSQSVHPDIRLVSA
ncbi:MAG TPA: DUF2934 domain-containing protein [Halothiobacillus sp.]|nr:DUF2934 domain-containing protein [Halothiobacillus sp.]